jgi:uncharacterized protein YndB with AHSA1/START domain
MDLATFVDRDTLVYERVYAHPIERVWEAVSTGEHLSSWLMPRVTVEQRAGGVATFTWGGTAEDDPFESYVIEDFTPPSVITFATPAMSAYMRFELAPVDSDVAASTRLRFTLHWPAPDDVPSPWMPQTLSTFHQTLDRLAAWLSGSSMADLDPGSLAEEYEKIVASR